MSDNQKMETLVKKSASSATDNSVLQGYTNCTAGIDNFPALAEKLQKQGLIYDGDFREVACNILTQEGLKRGLIHDEYRAM